MSALAFLGALVWSLACDDSVEPEPPKQNNVPPQTFLLVTGDSLQPQLYRLQLSWLGSDADGRVTAYRWRWLCEPGVGSCLVDSAWQETEQTSGLFTLPVPNGSASYVFEIAAIDDDGVSDPTPARQRFELFNNPPVGGFKPGTLPTTSLPAITFFFESADPDSSEEPDDRDSRATLSHYEVWLDGAESDIRSVPVETGAATLRLEDFEGRFGSRTLSMRVVDTGTAKSDTVRHTWTVESVPVEAVLLVDDCRMGGFLAQTSDRSYRNVLAAAGERLRILDIAAQPVLSEDDLSAQLELFSHVVWYTDADTVSSGALELARDALLSLLEERQGRLALFGGLYFGTNSAFGELEMRFRELFGIAEVFRRSPSAGTSFELSRQDTVWADVTPELTRLNMLSFGLREPVMDCYRALGGTRVLYWYPESTFVRGDFVNTQEFDIGVHRVDESGARTVHVSFPIGLPINSNMGENENEILELLKLAGILDP